MRAAVDCMGGDKAPAAILQGCWDAAPLLSGDDQVILIGLEDVILPALERAPIPSDKRKHYSAVVASQVIEMDDSPVEAIRTKNDSSISVMCKMCSRGEADVAISAGNTGACVAAAQLRMRTLPGVSRPGISVVFPTFHGPVTICDVGANIAPKPIHLHHYAIMASAYARAIHGIDSPRVGLMSIGEEDAKGTAIVKETRKFLRDEPLINFVGNVEGGDLFKGVCDVVVCDGFVGNIVLKLAESLAEALFQTIALGVQEADPETFDKLKSIMKGIYAKHDWQETGGAPLLGVDGYCLICHGRSEAKAIKNAIRVGKQIFDSKINKDIVEKIKSGIQE